jgi:ketosteroid isomerase-like protein
LKEKPVRAVEPRLSFPRRPWTDDPNSGSSASRPTFDFSKRGDDSVSGTVKRLENKWQAAIRDHDVATVKELLADNFVGTSSTGRVGSKSTLLAEIRKDKSDYKSVEARSMSVRELGEDSAVVTGITKESGTTKDGQSFKTARRFTDTWVKKNKQWRCLASQTTELAKE